MVEEASGTEQVAHPPTIRNRSAIILYGTETGNSEEIASEIGNMTERLHFHTVVDEMDAFKLSDLLQFGLVIFVISTTGQGDMPVDVAKFWKILRRGKLNNTNCLGRVKFTVFGLGDSSYQKFNWAARKLHVRMLQLGATEFFKSGEGDERHDNGIDSIYLPWYQDLRQLLLADYPPPQEPIPDNVLLPPKVILHLASSAEHSSSVNMENLSDAARFEVTKTKSAALTHIDNPRSEAEERDVHRGRKKLEDSAPIFARKDDMWEKETGLRADLLDKSNVLTDHPSKYLLQQREDEDMITAPEHLLSIPNSFVADVVSNTRITPEDHWQDVRFITLSVCKDQEPGTVVPSEIPPGSTVIVYPKNFPEDVEDIIALMGWEAICDIPLRFGASKRREPNVLHTDLLRRIKIHVDDDTTLRELLYSNFDFMSVPKRSFIRELAFFASDPREQERLGELCGMGNEQEFYDYTARPRRTILELLHDFPSVKIPWDRTIDLFPVIRGREFSIANGGTHMDGVMESTDTTIHIVAALVEYKTIIRKPRQGLCSRYLKSLSPDSAIVVTIKLARNNSLKASDANIERPIIAIATGTGIAPIRALIQERDLWQAKVRVGPILLFFGCRSMRADYHFKDEWVAFPDLHVIPAFSRDPITEEDAKHLDPYHPIGPSGEKTLFPQGVTDTGLYVYDYDRGKNYVQHQIRRHADKVCALMDKQPIICICGNSGRMPISVRQALVDALVLGDFCKDKGAANDFLNNPNKVSWWQETW